MGRWLQRSSHCFCRDRPGSCASGPAAQCLQSSSHCSPGESWWRGRATETRPWTCSQTWPGGVWLPPSGLGCPWEAGEPHRSQSSVERSPRSPRRSAHAGRGLVAVAGKVLTAESHLQQRRDKRGSAGCRLALPSTALLNVCLSPPYLFLLRPVLS